MSRSLLATLFALVAFGCAGAKPAPAPPPAAPAAPPAPKEAPLPAASTGAKKFGGQVVTVPTKGMPLVAFRIVFQAGSIDDPAGKEGITSLAADLMAEGGTTSLTSAQLLEALFPMAASIDVRTDKELTVFYGQVHRDHAERFIPLLTAAIAQPRWDPKEFARLREDALQDIEKHLRTSDDEGLGKASLDLVIWQGHPYAHYVGGTVDALKSLTLDEVKAHAAKVFSKDRMLIGLAGAVDDKLVAQVQQGLAGLPAQGAELIPLPEPKLGNPKLFLVSKDAQSTAISMGYPYALKRGEPDFYPMIVGVSALGEHRQFVGRLMKELRVKRGLNYGDYAYVEHFSQSGDTTFASLNIARRQQDFTVWLRPVATDNQLFALRAALYQIGRFAEGGLTEDEFETTRGFLKGYVLLWQQTPMRRLGYALDDVFYGTQDHLGGFRKSLESMTREQVNQTLKTWLHPQELRAALVTKQADPLRQAILENKPSPIKYVAEKPDPQVLAEDQKFVDLPLGVSADQISVEPAQQLFQR